MTDKHVVVDGSNIATEGRSTPSLRQLDEAVRAFMGDHPHDRVTVVVDATFGHRIDPSERAIYEEAVKAGELVSPPAGAIGRGDAFVLQIADRAGATVLSNDSFQEFHGQYEWLFEEGRLIGGKPVAGVGWIFLLRTPVRGPASRRSVRASKRPATASPGGPETANASRAPKAAKATKRAKATKPAKATKAANAANKASPRKAAGRKAVKAPPSRGDASGPETAAPGMAAAEPARGQGRTRRRRPLKSAEPVNEALPFIEFVAAHPVGTTVDGEVERFSSHGAYVVADGARCYVPLKAMADPPPRSAREVLAIGEVRPFVVESFDTPRRGIDLALPGFEEPTAVESADATAGSPPLTEIPAAHQPAEEAPVIKKATTKKSSAKKGTAKRSAAKKSSAKRSTAARKSSAKKGTARKSSAKKGTARKSSAKKGTAKKGTARKSSAKKSSAKKGTARKSSAKKGTARKSAARKSAAKKSS